MRKLTYGLNVSVDGYVSTPDGGLDWSAPSDELFAWWLEQEESVDTLLYGRGMWDTMAPFWPHADQTPDVSADHAAYARNWRDTEKIVFTSTPFPAQFNTRVVTTDAMTEIARLKASGGGLMRVAGARLGSSVLQAGLVDEITVVTHPVILGAGVPFLPALARPIPLRLVEFREFDGGITLSRYDVQ